MAELRSGSSFLCDRFAVGRVDSIVTDVPGDMGMKINGTAFLSGCAAVLLLMGAAACTSGGGGPTAVAAHPAGAACEKGGYAWFDVDERDALTGVAVKEKLGKGGGKLQHRPAPLHTPRAAVTFDGRRVGEEATLARWACT